MSNFTRVKPAGYSTDDPVSSAEFNQLDIDHAKSVNGDDGGTYAGAQIWTGQHDFRGGVIETHKHVVVAIASGGGVTPDTGAITPENANFYLLPAVVDVGQGAEVTLADPTDATKLRVLRLWRSAAGTGSTTDGPIVIKANGGANLHSFGDSEAAPVSATVFWNPTDTNWHVFSAT